MADKEISQFTDGTIPSDANYVGGYATANTVGGNRRWSFANIASYVNTKLGLGTMSIQDEDAVSISGGAIDAVDISSGTIASTVISDTDIDTSAITLSTINSTVIGGVTPANGTFNTLNTAAANITGGDIDSVSITNSDFSGTIAALTNDLDLDEHALLNASYIKCIAGSYITPTNTAGDNFFLAAWDVDGATTKLFGELTSNNIPSLAFSQPAGSLLTWDGGAIGLNTPAAAAFTTVDATTFTGALVGFASSANEVTVAPLGTNVSCSVLFSTSSGPASASINTDPDYTYNPSTNTLSVLNINNLSSLTMGIAGGTLILKQGANGKTGTVTLNGVTPVTITNSSITANSGIVFTLKTVGGTVGAYPVIQTITPTTGCNVAGTALDTSIYNYHIIESAA